MDDKIFHLELNKSADCTSENNLRVYTCLHISCFVLYTVSISLHLLFRLSLPLSLWID